MDTVYCFIAHGYNGSIQMVTLKFIAKVGMRDRVTVGKPYKKH